MNTLELAKHKANLLTEIGDSSEEPYPLQREAIKQAKITREDEDRIKIEIPEIGYVILTNTTPESEFSEDISEEQLEELGLDYQDFIGKIEHLYINPKSRGEGNAKLLMQKAIQYAEKKGMTPIYLNASPIQAEKGLGLNDLTKFYEKFGFETFKRQGQNNLMIRINKTNLEEVGTMKLTKILKEVISEIGESPTKPYNWEQVIFDEDDRAYNFSTSPDPNRPELGTYYEVNLNQMEPIRWDLPDEENGPSLAIEFGVIDQQGHKSTKTLTNKGEIYRVLSTVADIVKYDLKQHDYIKTLEFVPSQRQGKDTDKSNARLRIYTQYIIKQLGNSIDPKTAITNGSSGTTYVDLPKKKLSEIGDASKQPYGPIDLITDDEAERQYGFETESGTLYEVKVETFYRGPGRPVIARVNFGTIGDEGDISYDTQTGENDIYRIMSTIVQIVKKDLKSNHADIIEFSPSKREGGKDKDPMSNVRTKLYSRYIKGQFPNAEVTRTLLGDIQVILKP